MQRLVTVEQVRAAVHGCRDRGERVALVPTMGALHDGHLQLVDEARRRATRVVMSLFVNPTQFGPTEDFARYPRDAEGDAAKANARGVDMIFSPALDDMYPRPPLTSVTSPQLARRWEGEVRPGHFSGVLTVVAKLFNIVAPDVAVFGRKDLQQATLISRMVDDLDMPVEVIVCPTVREPDGLALSSRNAFLDAVGRRDALSLVTALRAVSAAFLAGERSGRRLTAIGERAVAGPNVRPDYFAVVDRDSLEPVDVADATNAAIVAARVGSTRLIDNMILGAPE